MKYFLALLAGVLFFTGNADAENGAFYLTLLDGKVRPGADSGTRPVFGLKTENIGKISGSPEAGGPVRKWRIALALSRVSGYTQYDIGGTLVEDGISTELHYPVSQLKFPANFNLLGLRVVGRIGRRYTLFAEGAKDASNNLGKMEDADFLPNGLAFIFSESDTEVDAGMLDAGVKFELMNNGVRSLAVTMGYRLEDFSYKVKNLDQWMPLDADPAHIMVSGLVGTYDVTYNIPYIGAAFRFFSGKTFKADFSFDYSPFIFVRDRDDHILRSILSKGRTDGNYYRGGVALSYAPENGFFAAFRVYRSHASAKGTYTSRIYSGDNLGKTWKIDHKNESSESFFTLLTGLNF